MDIQAFTTASEVFNQGQATAVQLQQQAAGAIAQQTTAFQTSSDSRLTQALRGGASNSASSERSTSIETDPAQTSNDTALTKNNIVDITSFSPPGSSVATPANKSSKLTNTTAPAHADAGLKTQAKATGASSAENVARAEGGQQMVPSETDNASPATKDKDISSGQPSSTVEGLAGSSVNSIAPKSLALQRFNQVRCVVGKGGEGGWEKRTVVLVVSKIFDFCTHVPVHCIGCQNQVLAPERSRCVLTWVHAVS